MQESLIIISQSQYVEQDGSTTKVLVKRWRN